MEDKIKEYVIKHFELKNVNVKHYRDDIYVVYANTEVFGIFDSRRWTFVD